METALETALLKIPSGKLDLIRTENPQLPLTPVLGKQIIVPVNTILYCSDTSLVEKIIQKNKDIRFESFQHNHAFAVLSTASLPASQNAELLLRVGIWNDAPAPPAPSRGVLLDGQAEFYMPVNAGGGKRL